MGLPLKGDDQKLLRYLNRGLEEGEGFLEKSPGYALIQHCVDRMAARVQQYIVDDMERPEGLATTSKNHFARVAKSLVAGMTDIKPFWVIKTFNPRFQQQSEIFSKLSEWWYVNTHADQKGLANALRWAVIGGTGYIHLQYDPVADEIDACALDPRDVVPLRAHSYDSIQDCYAVFVKQERTVNWVEEIFPEYEGQIEPDRDGSDASKPDENTKAGRVMAYVNDKLENPIKEALFGKRPKTTIGKQPAVTVYTCYIKDDSTNDGNTPLEVGDFEDDPTWTRPPGLEGLFAQPPRRAANNWSYLVKPKEKVYPRGRMIIFTSSLILFDGPNIYWHGKFPIIKLTIDPWPNFWLGIAPMWDLLSLQDSLDKTLRIIDDHNAQVAEPPVIGDALNVGPNGLDAVNTRKPGLHLITNPLGKPLEFPQVPVLDAGIYGHVGYLEKSMDETAGLVDMQGVMDLKQMPNEDTVEKLIEQQSSLLRGRSRVIEAFMNEFAHMLISDFAQFYTQKKRYVILGPRGNTPEDFDFDPGNLIPAFVHSEDFDSQGNLLLKALERGPQPKYNRAREVMRHMTYSVAPGSLLAGSSVTRKLLYLQLFREGAIDIWTLADVLDIPGYGEPPAGANTIPERLAAQASMGLMFGGGPPGVGGGGGAPGAPPTAQVPPHFGNNGNGPGSTIRESK